MYDPQLMEAGWQIMHSLQMLRVLYKNHHIFSSFLTASIVVNASFFGLVYFIASHRHIIVSSVFFVKRVAHNYLDQKSIVC